MVTNTKEYQKEYQAEYRKTHPQKQYKKSKEVKKGSKEVKNEMLEISLKRLRPPAKVEKEEVHDLAQIQDGLSVRKQSSNSSNSKALTTKFSRLDAGYQKWALSLETQRHYYYTKFGKVHRKNSIEVKKDLRVKNQELDMVELMKNKKAGLYRDCMNELKEVLKKRNEKVL